MSSLIDKAILARSESRQVDFKTRLDFDEPHTWCEIIKDLVALANSGGGVILLGADDSGEPTGDDVSQVLSIDPAIISDKVFKYTGVDLEDIEISPQVKNGHQLAALEVKGVDTPIVFTKPGTYPVNGNKQQTAFSKGTVYFRHGAKSEPGTSADLERFFQRRLKEVRKDWLSGLRKVVEAPHGAKVVAIGPGQEVVESDSPEAVAVRLTDDPNAPAYRKLDYDITHPYRQTELITKINETLGRAGSINSYDIQCVKQIYEVCDDEHFCHQPKYSSPQYSQAFVDWLVSEFKRDRSFFKKLRRKVRKGRA